MSIKSKVLITGVSGFIGFHLSVFLIKNNFDVIGVDNLNAYYEIKLKKSRLDILTKLNMKFFEKDQTYINIENKLSDFRYDEIDHDHFLNKLVFLKNNNFENFFEISVLDNNTIYYMVSNNDKKTQNKPEYSSW